MRHFRVRSISGAEVSKTLRNWCRSVSQTLRVSYFYGGTEMSSGHFGTSAVRSVLGPKCPYTNLTTAYFIELKLARENRPNCRIN